MRREPSAAGARDPVLAAYARDGFHVAPGVFGEAERARLRAAAAELRHGASSWAPRMNPHREHPAFLAAIHHAPVVALVERVLGGPVSAIQTQIFYGVPGTPGFTPHQDNHYVEAARDAFASAWTALDDVRRDNGALYVYPGSHREPLLAMEPLEGARLHAAQAANALRQHVVVPGVYCSRTLEVPAGSSVLLHGHLIHGSHDNHSADCRMALLMTYVRRGARFRAGASACRMAIPVYAEERP
ncbi:MAG: phytanoyl-CoA dioxygenase family protein [Thermodesulfobacteriota bacterium]